MSFAVGVDKRRVLHAVLDEVEVLMVLVIGIDAILLIEVEHREPVSRGDILRQLNVCVALFASRAASVDLSILGVDNPPSASASE